MSLELRETLGQPTLSLWQLLADKIQKAPSVVQIARDNIACWRQQGQTAACRLDEWEVLLTRAQASEAGLQQLIAVLLGQDERSARLKDFSPFAGDRMTARFASSDLRPC